MSDSCRVSIYRLVAPPGNEEMEPVAAQPDLMDLIADCDECLGEMHQKGMNESTLRRVAEDAFAKQDLKGLEKLLESMRKRIRTHDAQHAAIVPALDPAPSAPAASRAPPSSRPPIPNPSDSRTKSGGDSGLGRRQAIAPTQSKRRRIHTSSDGDFLVQFRAFAFAYGRDVLSKGLLLRDVRVQSLQEAFLASLPSDWTESGQRCPKKSIQHFFARECRADWERAVTENNIELFEPGYKQTPVQQAATIQEKLEIRPDLQH